LEFELIFCLEFGLWLGYFIISLGWRDLLWVFSPFFVCINEIPLALI
jgi:hypothetical protein